MLITTLWGPVLCDVIFTLTISRWAVKCKVLTGRFVSSCWLDGVEGLLLAVCVMCNRTSRKCTRIGHLRGRGKIVKSLGGDRM
jgi:hypothetical protein